MISSCISIIFMLMNWLQKQREKINNCGKFVHILFDKEKIKMKVECNTVKRKELIKTEIFLELYIVSLILLFPPYQIKTCQLSTTVNNNIFCL